MLNYIFRSQLFFRQNNNMSLFVLNLQKAYFLKSKTFISIELNRIFHVHVCLLLKCYLNLFCYMAVNLGMREKKWGLHNIFEVVDKLSEMSYKYLGLSKWLPMLAWERIMSVKLYTQLWERGRVLFHHNM